MKNYRELKVWSRSHALVLAIYRVTQSFPREEAFGLTSQLRRAAASVPANLAEGCGRLGDAELRRFALIALGSASELDYHLLLATDLGYLSAADSQWLTDETMEVRRMLGAFVKRLK